MNRTQNYTIRFTPNEWEGITKRANNKDMKLSEYIRAMIDKGELVDYKDKHDDGTKFTW